MTFTTDTPLPRADMVRDIGSLTQHTTPDGVRLHTQPRDGSLNAVFTDENTTTVAHAIIAHVGASQWQVTAKRTGDVWVNLEEHGAIFPTLRQATWATADRYIIVSDEDGDSLLDTATGSIVVSDCETHAPEDATLGRNFSPLVALLGPDFKVIYQDGDGGWNPGGYVLYNSATGQVVVADCETDAPESATLDRNFKVLVDLLNS